MASGACRDARADAEHIEAAHPAAFRRWLQANHATAPGVWLVYHRKASGKPSIQWSEAVDEALCFGWIDSLRRSIDDDRSEQWFSPRRPRSSWSRINKDKVDRLVAQGRMTRAGLAVVERARQDGSWSARDEADALREPSELTGALSGKPAARLAVDGWPPSYRRAIYAWVASARRDATKATRVSAILAAAAEGRRPL